MVLTGVTNKQTSLIVINNQEDVLLNQRCRVYFSNHVYDGFLSLQTGDRASCSVGQSHAGALMCMEDGFEYSSRGVVALGSAHQPFSVGSLAL